MPTLPPRAPFSLKSVFAGTMISTPASAGFAARTDGAKVIRVSVVMLTAWSASAWISGRKISPVPPARLFVWPAVASHALPTNG